jgi:hypothetical protein
MQVDLSGSLKQSPALVESRCASARQSERLREPILSLRIPRLCVKKSA